MKKKTSGDFVFSSIDLSKVKKEILNPSEISLEPSHVLICQFLENEFIDITPVYSDDLGDIASILASKFNYVGYPSTIRFYNFPKILNVTSTFLNGDCLLNTDEV